MHADVQDIWFAQVHYTFFVLEIPKADHNKS